MKNTREMTLEERRDFCRQGIKRLTPPHSSAQQAMLRMYRSLLELPWPRVEADNGTLEDMLARR